MPSPFPGMDPYLENPAYLLDFHTHTQAFIEIVRMPECEVVTVIEVLSPTNKTGDGRGLYIDKRQRMLRRPIGIVEIDLLRAGGRPQLSGPLPAGDYYTLVSRADRRPACEVYAWRVRDRLPRIPIPLRAPDPDVRVDLGQALTTAYQRGRYERMIDYAAAPAAPAFEPEDATWVADLAARAASQT